MTDMREQHTKYVLYTEPPFTWQNFEFNLPQTKSKHNLSQ